MISTFLEMSRDEDHGGGAWGFTNCVWAPSEKQGGGRWPFWTKVSAVREGDTIFHLRGVAPNAAFVGFSIASKDGFETDSRPPNPGKWNYSKSFFRADLSGFTPFHQPINLAKLLASRSAELNTYFDLNEKRKALKLNIFFVRQSGRLQCLNGAYLSEVDEQLFSALFGDGGKFLAPDKRAPIISVETGVQISAALSRIGQARFSAAVKEVYGYRCCFPECDIADSRFLVGSHIARWSDNADLRGKMGNGLCLCLVHDKAFEMGLFTVDQYFRVFVNPKEQALNSAIGKALMAQHGKRIRHADVEPLEDALLEHWIRVGLEP